MASAAYRTDLTFTPFRRSYGPAAGLMADSFFKKEVASVEPTIEGADTFAPQIVHRINRAVFEAAFEEWFDDTRFDSLPDMMKEHESFAEIVAGGELIVPLIAANLRREPSFLFLALEEITSDDPVPEQSRGNLKATVDAWLQWLRK